MTETQTTTEAVSTTPMMKQYEEIKGIYPDSILFFRLGDFYEMFNEDAKTASKVLEIALTTRNKNKENAIPLCGVPHHSAENYINKLIKNGYKVAVCEQMEDPRFAKGVVKREVVRVVTPGTCMNSAVINDKDNNFLCSIYPMHDKFGLAFIDLSTGEFLIDEFTDNRAYISLLNEIEKWAPKEILIPASIFNNNTYNFKSSWNTPSLLSPYEDLSFKYEYAYKILLEHFGVLSLTGFGCDDYKLALSAAGAVIKYIKETQKSSVTHINKIALQNKNGVMKLDSCTIKSLELTKRSEGDEKEGTLLSILDLTVTAMGGRRLKKWISLPLTDGNKIRERLDAVDAVREEHIKRERLKRFLEEIYDIERILGRLTLKSCNARDLVSLKNSIKILPDIHEIIYSFRENAYIKELLSDWDNLSDIHSTLESSILEEPPFTLKEGGMIKEGVDTELDAFKKLVHDGKKWMTELEKKERERTGISSLKIGYTNVYGYFIEITKKNIDKVPSDYIRKHSLSNAERFISSELKEYETKVLSAEEKIFEIEYRLFEEIRKKIVECSKRIQETADRIADLDAIISLSNAALKYNYVKPEITDEDIIYIKDGRHPIIEQLNSGDPFIPNDTILDSRKNRIAIITGPNMAGKSTYLRQTALIALMAHIGSFVPAKEAKISVLDTIFTRVGAHDNLLKGQSTFMVEMSEAANILNNSTAKSLIILDEIGRGTSTFDGISIAWGIVEHINKIGAKTLFATHYFELTELAYLYPTIKNYNVSIKEWNDEILFLRKIAEGSADKSYGIQVARLAGLPDTVINKAREILATLENKEAEDINNRKEDTDTSRSADNYKQLDLFGDNSYYDIVIKEIKELNVNDITPMQALNTLNDIKERLK